MQIENLLKRKKQDAGCPERDADMTGLRGVLERLRQQVSEGECKEKTGGNAGETCAPAIQNAAVQRYAVTIAMTVARRQAAIMEKSSMF